MTVEELADGVVAVSAPGDPTSGAVAGSEGVLSIDALGGFPVAPVHFLLLTHHHVVPDPRAPVVMAHAAAARRMDPRPTLSFADELRITLGDRDVVVGGVGRGHTAGDAVAWLPAQRVLFTGGLVAGAASPSCAEAHLAEWRSATLARVAAFRADVLVPAAGPAVRGPAVAEAIDDTRAHLDALCLSVARTVAGGGSREAALERAEADLTARFGHAPHFADRLPANVARAFDELQGLPAER